MAESRPLVLIMAAGLGTRMKSELPKVLHRIAGRPMLHWVVGAARAAGAERVVAILGHKSEVVKASLDASFGANHVEVALQPEQRGTGHAVQCALPAIEKESDDRIVVILTGDAPLLASERIAELVAACAKSPAGMALLSTVPPRPMPYGRLVRDEHGTLAKIVEHADASAEVRRIADTNAGFYAIRLGHLRRDLAALRADNAKGELYLTDLVAHAHARGGATAIDAPFTEVAGINDRVDLAGVEVEARRRINEAWMRAGVTMVDPSATYIDADVGPIGKDVWLAPNVALRGKTTIADHVRIDLGSVVVDTSVAESAYLKPYSVLGEATIGPRTEIGPFTHCRPGTRIDDGARLGNFVETKKAHLMAGAKANHLAYLGDASIGAKANIGAGTITCNYDGVSKHKTTIEAGAFIGSDSQLVAPVTVGRDAYVGSGTTVTKDVPRGALALSRTMQINKDGWADRMREAQAKRKKNEGGGGDH
ncbi:MAG: bifunctional UDP-N-acetylglucosamine diphosphorylase/glucosamine-1-phosphate N-acetyltransferase GlmU [Deltaproteobacteria bacterium]|nr:bifunctional UDP-N-acetylglucosamine diphosphorylase/glucosamine-1-phosphate N-acetyltransferase GlmU [Deltaproteobacteria bacterium]MCW5805970.1 bifunctional UDP-N-acetylglucosamine diphosphorylase/glucosamine-1-phosphate N-acetyltransferase GlmU [Deltaproteobacteria bacterium]